jgi:uncharacterized repeat protein (TIGR01451 family)
VPIDNNPSAQLALSANKDPVLPGEQYTLLLDIGNIGNSSLGATELRAFLPAGATVVDDGGGDATSIAGEVSWDLSTVDVGVSLHYEVLIAAPDLAAEFSTDILKARAQLTFTGGGEVDVIAEHAVTVHNASITQLAEPELLLTVATNDVSVPSGGVISYTITLTNTSQQSLSNVQVMYRVPTGTSFRGDTAANPIIDGGSCINNYDCVAGEEAWWTFATIGTSANADATRTIQIFVTELGNEKVGSLVSAPIIGTTDSAQDTISILYTVPIVTP